jgi:Spy/CpxP family protein refolding chaperone
MRKLLLILAATAMLLPAQLPQRSDGASIMIYPPPVSYFDDLKQYLGLSDAQLEQLRQILADRDRATQAIYQQISAKQMELHNLMESGSNDALRIGTLTLEIRNLQKQIGSPQDSFRQRALAVLTPEQRTKLAGLDQVLKLSPAASQGVMLLLLEPPPPGPPVILGRPLPVDTKPEPLP